MKMNRNKSIENQLSGQAEPLTDERTPAKPVRKQQPGTGATPDGVYADGMAGSDTGITQEICSGGEQSSTEVTSPAKGEDPRAGTGVGAADSSVDLWDMTTHGERSGSAFSHAPKRREGPGDGPAKAGIRTPAKKVRKLQIALYRKAKAEPKWRFYSLYGEIAREDLLWEAWRRVKARGGAGGIDGVTVSQIERAEGGAKRWLGELSRELKAKSYRAAAVRRVMIPKPDGKERPLGIPTIKDRVVQTAVWLVLMPIYEADFHPQSYGYRPRRNARQAMEAIKAELWKGRTEIVDADLSAYFDTIDHRLMLRKLVKRISDGSLLGLIKQWLRAPVMEEGPDGERRSRGNRRGTPQGGVISPLLANIFLNDLDYGVNEGTQHKARMVRYADDLVILCAPGQAAKIKERLTQWLERRGLRLNEEKTRIVEARKEGFEFLGWRVTPRRSRRGLAYYHMEPAVKSRVKLMEKVREILQHRMHWRDVNEVVAELNAVTRGWSQYFRYGHWREVFHQMDDVIGHRLRKWLWNKQRRSKAQYGHYTKQRMKEQYGWTPMTESYV